ncbi:MAG: hypothetical protein NQU46_08000 [Methanolinea sp.]|nr:hypothetical protein [Methanolinea sp.]
MNGETAAWAPFWGLQNNPHVEVRERGCPRFGSYPSTQNREEADYRWKEMEPLYFHWRGGMGWGDPGLRVHGAEWLEIIGHVEIIGHEFKIIVDTPGNF